MISSLVINGLFLLSETFDDNLQAMDFAQAKIHSLVTVADGEGEGAGSPDDTERMRFKEVESRFLSQFSMPEQEKLVNCEFACIYVCTHIAV